MDWEHWWQIVLGTFAVALLIFGVVYIRAPKNVDYYYISHGQAMNPATCVYAHWTWHNDEFSFCTDDAGRALDFVARANATIKK